MRSPCCLCVYVSPLLTFESMNQYLWNLICISWHLSKSHASVCVSICVFPIVTRKWLGKNVTAAKNTHATIEGKCWTSRILYDPCRSSESNRFFLPRTYCLPRLNISAIEAFLWQIVYPLLLATSMHRKHVLTWVNTEIPYSHQEIINTRILINFRWPLWSKYVVIINKYIIHPFRGHAVA
jgi:hypothetical protein